MSKSKDGPLKPRPQPAAATFDSLSQACTATFPVVLAVGGQLLSVPVRRLTAEESAHVAELLEQAIPKRVPDPQSGEDRYDTLDAEYLRKKRELQWLARAWVLVRGVPLIEEGWNAWRQEQAEPCAPLTVAPLEKHRPALQAAARWLAGKFPEDVLERLRGAVESDTVDEEALTDFFSSGS